MSGLINTNNDEELTPTLIDASSTANALVAPVAALSPAPTLFASAHDSLEKHKQSLSRRVVEGEEEEEENPDNLNVATPNAEADILSKLSDLTFEVVPQGPVPNFEEFKNKLLGIQQFLQQLPTNVDQVLEASEDFISKTQLLDLCRNLLQDDLVSRFIQNGKSFRSVRIDKGTGFAFRTIDIISIDQKLHVVILTHNTKANDKALALTDRVKAEGTYKVFKPAFLINPYRTDASNPFAFLTPIAKKRVKFREIMEDSAKDHISFLKDNYVIREELRIAKTFDHPNVALLFEGSHFIREKYATSFFMSQYLYSSKGAGPLEYAHNQEYTVVQNFCNQNNNIPVTDVIFDIICQMAESVKVFHDRNIGHFDLKNSNFIVYVTQDPKTNQPKLLIKLDDFGAAIDMQHTKSLQQRFLKLLGFNDTIKVEGDHIFIPTNLNLIFDLCPIALDSNPKLQEDFIPLELISKKLEELCDKNNCVYLKNIIYHLMEQCLPPTTASYASPQTYWMHIKRCSSQQEAYNRLFNKPNYGQTQYKLGIAHGKPELYTQPDPLDLKNDIYSLGICIFKLLQGNGLLKDKKFDEVMFMDKLCAAEIDKRYDISKVLDMLKGGAMNFMIKEAGPKRRAQISL